MKEFQDKVAVITGAASGIGRGLADRCAQEGMKVVLADVEVEALTNTAADMQAAGATVLAVPTDVSKASDVEALAHKTLATFGAVHLLCNNAGVGAGTSIWESTLADWEWVLGVNLWGVIHGVRVFVPIMLAQETEGHIVNTASIAGLISGPGLGIYKVSKHAVVTLSETLYHELALQGAKVNVSVLCPGFVNTRILDSARNRPVTLSAAAQLGPRQIALQEAMRQALQAGMSPDQVADHVFNAIKEDKFYIFTHPELQAWVRTR
jgi:NAD(P)-dependent dehydrogenase (short-subunit alcohol dehydrogenase family)